MKTVFPNREIPHKWVHQTQSDARGSHIFFEGPTIYSYGRHFPIATIHEHKTRGKLILFTSRDYSATTAKHKSYVSRAIPHDWRTIVCPHVLERGPEGRHGDNITDFERRKADAHAMAKRRKSLAWAEADARDGRRAWEDLRDYCAFFGIRRKIPPAPDFSAAIERARRIENPDPAHAARLAKAREQRDALSAETEEYRAAMIESMKAAGHGYLGYRVHVGKRWQDMLRRKVDTVRTPAYVDAARRTDWRLFGAFDLRGMPDRPCMLRVNGDEIETSQGARVPTAEAQSIYRLWRAARASGGREFGKGLGERVKVGDYPLDSIDAHGTLRAGCHVIPASEIQATARALGLA